MANQAGFFKNAFEFWRGLDEAFDEACKKTYLILERDGGRAEYFEVLHVNDTHYICDGKRSWFGQVFGVGDDVLISRSDPAVRGTVRK